MKHSKKLFAAGLAATMAVNAVCLSNLFSGVAADAVKYEFENGTISGTSMGVEEDASASGGQYVFMKNAGETLSVTVNVEEAGMYDLNICYKADSNKTQKLKVNGVSQSDVTFPATSSFTEIKATSVQLAAGENTIEMESFWGWTQFDYMTVTTKTFTELKSSNALCDPKATKEAQSLMTYLSSVYGKGMISGQQEFYGVSRDDEFNFIEDLSGELPAIRGFDFGDTCPLYAWEDGATDRMIDWVNNKGGIATASWHINVPKTMANYTVGSTMAWDQTTYSEKTDFVTANVMVEGTKEHEFFLIAVDNLATQLKKAQDANVPILFRPFHEAEGNGGADGSGSWFWWSKEGADVYVELYQYLYKLLTEEYDLHNLIWEFNSYTYSDESKYFYPGDNYVDLVGYDKYNAKNWNTGAVAPNESAISGIFYDLVDMYDNNKMIAMMENDTVPSLENIQTEHAYWLYFMPWYGEHLMDSNYNNPDTLKELYQSEWVITLDELPDDLYTNTTPGETTTTLPGQTTTTTTKRTTTTTTTTQVENAIMATIKKDGENFKISFSTAMGDKVYLVLDVDESVTKANGCLGISVTVDGTDYWVSYKWEITKSDEVIVDLSGEPFNVVLGGSNEAVTDQDVIAKVVEAAQEQKNAEVQMWWASDSTGTIDTTNVALTAAYIPDNGGSETTTTTEDTTTTTEETTTTVTTVDTVETTTPETTTTEDTTETTTTTNGGDVVSYGDVNLDGKVDLIDAITMNKYMAGVIAELTPAQFANANCDISDGTDTVNEDDATALTNFVIMIEKSLPVNNPSTN
ncbi:MAG: glycosyl hydrolase [Ruminococcus callidus]|nr:glycosyl hydrolase [Ruminococcus callidus]